MGLKISAEKFYGGVQGMNYRVIGKRPQYVKLNNSQKELSAKLHVSLANTCQLCESLRSYADIITMKNNRIVEIALPRDDDLCFDKTYVLSHSIDQVDDFNYHMHFNGFIPHIAIAYLGRLFVSMRRTIDDEIHNEDIIPCRDSIDNSLKTLREFCAALPKEHIENNNIVWITEEKFDNQLNE